MRREARVKSIKIHGKHCTLCPTCFLALHVEPCVSELPLPRPAARVAGSGRRTEWHMPHAAALLSPGTEARPGCLHTRPPRRLKSKRGVLGGLCAEVSRARCLFPFRKREYNLHAARPALVKHTAAPSGCTGPSHRPPPADFPRALAHNYSLSKFL